MLVRPADDAVIARGLNTWALMEQSLTTPCTPFVTRIRIDFNFKL